MTDTDNARPDDDIDTELGERYYRNDKGLEVRLTEDIVEVIRQFIAVPLREVGDCSVIPGNGTV